MPRRWNTSLRWVRLCGAAWTLVSGWFVLNGSALPHGLVLMPLLIVGGITLLIDVLVLAVAAWLLLSHWVRLDNARRRMSDQKARQLRKVIP